MCWRGLAVAPHHLHGNLVYRCLGWPWSFLRPLLQTQTPLNILAHLFTPVSLPESIHPTTPQDLEWRGEVFSPEIASRGAKFSFQKNYASVISGKPQEAFSPPLVGVAGTENKP